VAVVLKSSSHWYTPPSLRITPTSVIPSPFQSPTYTSPVAMPNS